ncbi:MAG: zinc ABC transporter substrate-binding protein, partial [Treponema sp.]|nr:zinc ABC transporter substrate-binding protein [Treponema sp.]
MSIKKFMIAGMMLAAAGMAFAKTKIVTTIFPEYDWVREIAGDKAKDAEITLLIGNGVDLHSYQLSVKDIAKISTADIFIYVGGESDEWVDDVLKNAKNKDMKVINLMEVLGDKVKVEEVVEGMQAEEEEHEHEEGHHH